MTKLAAALLLDKALTSAGTPSSNMRGPLTTPARSTYTTVMQQPCGSACACHMHTHTHAPTHMSHSPGAQQCRLTAWQLPASATCARTSTDTKETRDEPGC